MGPGRPWPGSHTAPHPHSGGQSGGARPAGRPTCTPGITMLAPLLQMNWRSKACFQKREQGRRPALVTARPLPMEVWTPGGDVAANRSRCVEEMMQCTYRGSLKIFLVPG
eukprot:1157271-Pelagomonas_calceolata.AAC.21